MAQNHPVYVYRQNCKDFANTGICGDLRPLEATFTEEKNGESQVVIKIPYDQFKKWTFCQVGNILKCEVPVRMPPVIQNDEYATSTKIAK